MPETAPSDWRRFAGAGFSQKALKAAAARKTEIRHAIRVSAAVGAAFALATLLRLPQGYWAVFTAVIVVQSSLGATITASMERFMGTVVGALAGAVAAYFHAKWPEFGGVILCVTVALLSFVVSARPALKVAPVTAVIMLIGQTTRMDPLIAASLRVAEITVGSLMGVAATLLIFPARAHASVVTSVQKIAGLQAHILDSYILMLRGTPGPTDYLKAQDDLRAALAKLQTSMTEADRENASKLSERSVSDALPRTLWRLRNDTVMVGRTLREPLPAEGLAGRRRHAGGQRQVPARRGRPAGRRSASGPCGLRRSPPDLPGLRRGFAPEGSHPRARVRRRRAGVRPGLRDREPVRQPR